MLCWDERNKQETEDKKMDIIGIVANLDHKSSLTQVKTPIIIPRVYHQQKEHCWAYTLVKS